MPRGIDEAIRCGEIQRFSPNPRHSQGGLKTRYHITKADGREVDSSGVYFVLKLNSKDIHHANASRRAAEEYAKYIKAYIPELASDLITLVNHIEDQPDGEKDDER